MGIDRPKPLFQRMFAACLLLLGGVIALSLALQILSQIWGWFLLIVGLASAVWVAVRIVRVRRNQW